MHMQAHIRFITVNYNNTSNEFDCGDDFLRLHRMPAHAYRTVKRLLTGCAVADSQHHIMRHQDICAPRPMLPAAYYPLHQACALQRTLQCHNIVNPSKLPMLPHDVTSSFALSVSAKALLECVICQSPFRPLRAYVPTEGLAV